MPSSVNPHTSIIAILMENHFKELLDLTPEQLKKVIAKLELCFSGYFFPEQGLKRDVPTDDDLNLNDGLPDFLILNDLVRQVWAASKERFIKLGNSCLVEAEMEREAQAYMEKATTAIASGVEFEPLKIWNLSTIHYETFKKLGDMGFFKTSATFEPPTLKDSFPTPAPDWKPNQVSESSMYDQAGIIAADQVEDNTSTLMEETNPVELLHIGEVTAQSVIGAAAEETQI